MSSPFPQPDLPRAVQPVHAPPPPRKKSSKALWLVLLLIPLGLLAVVLFVVGTGALFILTATEEAPSETERRLVVDAEAVAEYTPDFTPRPEFDVATKHRYIDRSFDIEYEYDDPDENAPYLNSSLTVERNLSDARTSYVSLWGGAIVGMKLFGDVEVEIAERNDLFQWGDQSRFAVVKFDGRPGGNLFIARKGKKVFYLLLAGVYFDDADGFRSLVGPVLERVERYKP